jgi:hypothetical protein
MLMGSLWPAVAVAMLLAPAAAPPKTFVSKAGFSVIVPGAPVETVPAEGIHVLESMHDGVDYAVSVVRLLGGKTGDDVWTFARQNNENQFKTKVVSEEPVKLQGLPGRVYRLQPPGQSVRAWTYLDRAGMRLYNLLVILPANRPEPTEVTVFLKSFQVSRPGRPPLPPLAPPPQ